MTIYTSDAQLGSRSSSGIFTVGTRYGADGDIDPCDAQILTPSWKRSCVNTYFGATCTVTYIDDLSWKVVGAVGGSGWFRSYAIFLGTVNSGSYANGSIDAEITCYSGDDAAELVGMHGGDTCSGSDVPEICGNTTPDTGLAVGATAWFEGAGSYTYQTGYFGVIVSGNYHTGSTVDAYFRLNRLRWGDVIVWDSTNKGIQTSNVRHG